MPSLVRWCRKPQFQLLLLLLLAVSHLAAAALPRRQSLNGAWNLWFDEKADWQHEELARDPHNLAHISTYSPTIGWDEMLKQGQPYRVPATWDEAYPRHHGVGWYWRAIQIPSTARGKVIRLRFAAVRLRAEVYLNRQLVGYSLDGSTPFEIDITHAVRYGAENLLAVRVTNPGGGTSWIDFLPIQWGKVQLPDSHDFGGIWQDADLLITPRTFVQDVYVEPLEDLKTIRVVATVANQGPAQKVRLIFAVHGPSARTIEAQATAESSVEANSKAEISTEITVPNAKTWSPDTPFLYTLEARLASRGSSDEAETPFGIRFFTEKNGKLFLNGQRVFVRSSINFGFYPFTVSYPSPELAEKEVKSAKLLGLNTLSCHRTCCTPALLNAADRLGLMIYEEPGGAPRERKPEPQSPAEAFERQVFLEKLNRLVVRDRNHPCLIWWNLANEAFQDVVNDPEHLAPYIDQMVRTVHRLDPSRFVTYTSGRQSTVMFRPFEKSYGLIYDYHTVENVPAVWRDALTLEHSTFQAPLPNEAFYNGESRCLTSLGDLPALAGAFARAPDGSYEAVWRQWAEMLEKSFKQYNLGRYFKSPEELCRFIGIVQGTGFSREVEGARLSDAASGLAINGWQSHPELWAPISTGNDKVEKFPAFWTSGLVDSLRNPNFPPDMLARVNEPVHLAIVPIPSTAFAGQRIQLRTALINERQVKGPGQLTLELSNPGGNTQVLSKAEVPIEADPLRFVQELATNEVVLEGASGYYKLKAELRLPGGQTLESERSVLVGNRGEWKLPSSGIVLEDPTRTLAKYFEAKSLFYPDHASPQSAWQPVEMIYNPQSGGFEEGAWAPETLTTVAEQGKTILLWATDSGHGQTIVGVLQKLKLLPDEATAVPLGLHWFGGWNFNTPHPVFAGLPAPVVFNQEFSAAFAYWGISEFPGTLVAGLINAPPQVAVTLGELPFRKGKIIVCALNLVPYLDKDPVADRILAQLLTYAVTRANVSADDLRHAVAGKIVGQ
ncbi:MAG: sugar-binding domain-containing protein [Terriglobia bacterium]